MKYQIENEDLAEAIAAALTTPKHRALQAAVRQVPGFEGAEITAQRDEGSTFGRRRVIDDQGTVIAEDHEAYLRAQVEQDGGNAHTTWQRLADAGLRLSTIHIERIYFVVDRGGAEQNFLQLEIWLQREVVDQLLANAHFVPADLTELIRASGYMLADEIALGTPVYQLHRIIDVAAFVALGAEMEGHRQRQMTERMAGLAGVDARTGATVQIDLPLATEAALTWKGLRIFQDWALSSAGRCGARFCRHWALQLGEWTSPEGERHFSLIPLWVTSKPPARVEARRLGDYELYGRLLKMDDRMGVPMAYFFFGLHGNRVSSEALHRVLQAAESGLIVMQEHDYQILKRWGESTYGF